MNRNGKRPHSTVGMYPPPPVVLTLDMEELFLRMQNVDNTTLTQPFQPTTNSVPQQPVVSQFDDNCCEAASSLLLLSTGPINTTPTASIADPIDDPIFSPNRGFYSESESECDIDGTPNNDCPLDATATSFTPPFPTVTHITQIPQDETDIINSAIADVFAIGTPCPWKIEVIHHSLFKDDDLLFVSCRTPDGKSLLPLSVATFKRRVTIVLVPLIGLGSDQVQKSSYYDHNFEAYHLDEHKGQDTYDLRDCIVLMEKKEMDCMFIFLICYPSVVGQTPGETTRG